MLTRKEFLKTAGTGAAGLALLGVAGCDDLLPNLPDKFPIGGQDPSVVLIILDTLRRDHLGAYGNGWIETPSLDALARESLRFTQARPESAPTICARRAIHTGIRTWPFRDWRPPKGENIILQGWQPMPEGQTTLAEILKEHGYQTMFVTDNLHQFKASYNFQRGFDVFDWIRGQTTDHYHPLGMTQPDKMRQTLGMRDHFRQYFANTAGRETEEDWFAPQVFTRASEFLEAARGGQPFFLAVDCFDPHQPWDPPEEYVKLYDGPYDGREPYSPINGSSSYLTDRELKRMQALYAAEVTMTDRWLGRFLEKMRELALFENTLLILLSDHGIALGEHGIVGKPFWGLWPEVTDVPFFIRHPKGKGAGQTSDYYASTHDVAPTILGFLGIDPPEPMNGQNLSVLLDGGKPEPREHFTLGYHDHVWARDERYIMFARNDGAKAKLYDAREDPGMRNDVAGERPGEAKRMFEKYVLKDASGTLPRY